MIAVDGPQLRTGPGVHAWGDALLPRLGAPPRAVVPTTNFPDEFLPCCTDTNRAVRTRQQIRLCRYRFQVTQ